MLYFLCLGAPSRAPRNELEPELRIKSWARAPMQIHVVFSFEINSLFNPLVVLIYPVMLAESMSLLLPNQLKAWTMILRGSWRHFSTCRARLREDYVRDRTNVNIVTLGASQHGKTLLCSRLTEALSANGVPVKKVDRAELCGVYNACLFKGVRY